MAEAESELELEGVEVIVGTYEEFILGYKLARNKETEEYSLSMSFTNHSQSRSVRSITSVGKYIAAGSADETINLINMAARVEHGTLHQQSGTITCLAEHNGNYLFSGCEDGTICIWKKGSWLCEKTLNAHTGGVIDVSIHPSGKIGLSVGKDKALKTWNLVKGRCGYVTNLKTVADAVRWSPEGGYYAISLSNRVDVYNLQTAKVICNIPFGKRVSCMTFLNENTIAIAGDKEVVELYDISANKKLHEFACHKVRVKAIQFVPNLGLLFTSSNDGLIKIWKYKQDQYSKLPKLLTEIDTTCRITCMTIWKKEVDESKDEEMDVEDNEEEEETVEDDQGEDKALSDDSENEDEESSEDEPMHTHASKKRRKVEVENPKLTSKSGHKKPPQQQSKSKRTNR